MADQEFEPRRSGSRNHTLMTTHRLMRPSVSQAWGPHWDDSGTVVRPARVGGQSPASGVQHGAVQPDTERPG